MKKILIALLCAIMLSAGACAESPAVPPRSPAPETVPVSSAGGMEGTLNGMPLTLEFDPDPMFSIQQDGYIQASFFAYGEGDLLYELYMTFPQAVQSGDVLTPESSLRSGQIASGLMLFVSDANSEICSAASQYASGAYPDGSGYSMNFTDVTVNGASYTFSGSMDAKLAVVDMYYNPTSEINELSADFSFTMDLGSASSAPYADHSTPEPALPPSEGQDGSANPDVVPETEPTVVPPEERPPLPPTKLITPQNAQKV